MGFDLHFFKSFHPHIDGQMARVNRLLEIYLKYFVSANQIDWEKLMDMAQFSYNLQRNDATKKAQLSW